MSDTTKTTIAPVEDAQAAVAGENEESNVVSLHAEEKPAKRDVAENAGVYVHKFRKTFEYEGKKYDTLNFYFERLTGRDMISIENEMQANNEYALDPLLSRNFQSKMAARAGAVAVDTLEAMPMQEFNKITNAARNFLIDSGY